MNEKPAGMSDREWKRSSERGAADESLLFSTVTSPDGIVISVGDFLKQKQGVAMFTKGTIYAREAIHVQVGGNDQPYLTRVNGKIVAACLREDKNPGAPHVILVEAGKYRKRDGELLVAQEDSVPMFISKEPKKWEYVGDYRAVKATSDPDKIKVHAEQRTDIVLVIFMEPVAPG